MLGVFNYCWVHLIGASFILQKQKKTCLKKGDDISVVIILFFNFK